MATGMDNIDAIRGEQTGYNLIFDPEHKVYRNCKYAGKHGNTSEDCLCTRLTNTPGCGSNGDYWCGVANFHGACPLLRSE